MAENPNKTPQTEEAKVEKTSRIKDFVAKHPRATKVVGITAVATVVVAAGAAVKNRKQDADSTETTSTEGEFASSPETPAVTEA